MLFAIASVGEARAQDAPDGAAPTARPSELVLLYHADLDGAFARPDCQRTNLGDQPSYPQLLGLMSSARLEAAAGGRNPPIVLLGGNLAAPDLFGRTLIEQGHDGTAKVAALLARASYDAIALGSRDVALDAALLQGLVDAITSHGLPVVVSNLSCDEERAPLCQRTRRSLLVRRGSETIGILATVSPSVLTGVAAAARVGIHLDDPLTVARAASHRLREQGASRVLLMAQGPRDRRGLEELDALQRALADDDGSVGKDAPTKTGRQGPDLILVGAMTNDDHRSLRLLERDDAPPAVGSATGADALSQVVLSGAGGRGEPVTVRVQRLPASGPTQPPPDADAQALIVREIPSFCRQYGEALSPPPARGQLSRDEFVRYALEIMRRKAHAEIAILNRALVKAGPFPITGPISRGQLYGALPYKAIIGVARVTGATVEQALGPTLDSPKAATVGLLRDGGQLRVNGRALDKARSYRVATIAFVASGGDAIVDAKVLSWKPLPGQPDLRETVAAFLQNETGSEDGDARVDPSADFGPPPELRLLLVGLSDGGLDFVDTRINNSPDYGDPQLTRGRQQVWKAEWTGLLQSRHPRHETDSRLNLKYGRTWSKPAAGQATSTETNDLVTLTSLYNYRGLRTDPAMVQRYVPDPYARAEIESEFTRPAPSDTQPRTYHHLELTSTLGALFTLMPALKVRAGVGVRRELLTQEHPFGRWRPVVEAGGTLSPIALATVGPLPVRLEGLVDYTFVDPTYMREHRLRATGKLSLPLLPLLFFVVGLDVFAVQRQQQGWAASYDTTIGLRVHLDSARQWL